MNVTVYSTPTCPWCVKVKDWLTANNVEFEDVNVAADRDRAREMIDKSGQMGVPVTDIDGKLLVGYDETKLKEMLGM